MRKIIAVSVLIGLLTCVNDTARAGKVHVEEYAWWGIVEKMELSLNRGDRYITVFDSGEDVLKMTSDSSIRRLYAKNSKIPEGTYNYFKITLTAVLWKMQYNDGKNGSAMISPDIDDRETYEVIGPTLVKVNRNTHLKLFIHVDTYRSLRECDAYWNGVSYTLDELKFFPEITIYESESEKETIGQDG
ncbi:hypothetical protein ACFL42_03500 [Candidatus Omnitrophota bacterium]